jgi:hypothetical protein
MVDLPPVHDDFDMHQATTLWWQACPVLLRNGDRDDAHETLTFRILSVRLCQAQPQPAGG